MEKLPDITQGLTLSPHSTQLSRKPSAERQQVAVDAAKRILANYPDYGKADPHFAVAMTEFLSHLTPKELELVMDPRTGIHTRCKFLPTPADINELLDEPMREEKALQARLEAVRPAPTTWHKAPSYDIDQPPAERRKAQVMAELGYDPQNRAARRDPHAFETIKADDFKSSDQLKTKPRPASEELKQLLRDQGYGHPITHPTNQDA